jgi:hypothetical protein
MAGSGFAFFCWKTGCRLDTFKIQENESATKHYALANAIDRFRIKACFLIVRKRAFIVEGKDAFCRPPVMRRSAFIPLKLRRLSAEFWYPEVVIGPSIIIVYLSVACASPVAAVRSSSIFLFSTMTWKGERWSGQKTS